MGLHGRKPGQERYRGEEEVTGLDFLLQGLIGIC
jgi:hypothetical protein